MALILLAAGLHISLMGCKSDYCITLVKKIPKWQNHGDFDIFTLHLQKSFVTEESRVLTSCKFLIELCPREWLAFSWVWSPLCRAPHTSPPLAWSGWTGCQSSLHPEAWVGHEPAWRTRTTPSPRAWWSRRGPRPCCPWCRGASPPSPLGPRSGWRRSHGC